MFRKIVFIILFWLPVLCFAQYNTERLLRIGRSALYYEDYVLSMQYFNQAIGAKPYLYEPWFLRAVAKYYLDDFVGSEADCTEAIQRNPYVINVYELRGLTRIRQERFEDAVADYSQALKYDPMNRSLWHNRVLCRIQQKDYEAAHADLDTVMTHWKNYARAYAMRAEVYMLQNDTANAIVALDKSIQLDAYDGSTWSMRAIIDMGKSQWSDAEKHLDKAIHLLPKNTGNYINRALSRYHQSNLRGAMADYDMALDIDPNNFLGHYNRGLLRAQVGDDNRAIVDFDFVLTQEPDNMMALFNRALLLDKTGDIRSAIRDYTKVLEHYPDFLAGYQHRAESYRKLGMNRQAEMDEFRVYKAQMDRRYGSVAKKTKATRKRHDDKDPDKYNQLVVDDSDEMEIEYENAYRGRVQNRKATLDFMPMYELTLEPYEGELKTYVAYDRIIDDFNAKYADGQKVYINSEPSRLTEQESAKYFRQIDSLTIILHNNPNDTKSCLKRALAYSVVQDQENAIADLTVCLDIDSTSVMALWQRAACLFRQSNFSQTEGADGGIRLAKITSDLTAAIGFNSSPYLYYNRGNVNAKRSDYAAAIADYTKALQIDPNIPEAYYNRGIAHIMNNDISVGIADLSKAGELGLYTAYSVIKKYSK